MHKKHTGKFSKLEKPLGVIARSAFRDAAISIFQIIMNYEIAEFIPSVNTRLLRLWLAMTNEGPLAKTA